MRERRLGFESGILSASPMLSKSRPDPRLGWLLIFARMSWATFSATIGPARTNPCLHVKLSPRGLSEAICLEISMATLLKKTFHTDALTWSCKCMDLDQLHV